MFFTDKEQYLNSQATWARTNEHQAYAHIAYNILRGKRPDLGFTPIKDAQKIQSNSLDRWNGYNKSLRLLKRIIQGSSSKNALGELLGFSLTQEFLDAIQNTAKNV